MRLALSPGMPSQPSCGGFFIAVAPSTAHPSDRTINGHSSVVGAPQVTLRSRPAPGWARPQVIGIGMADDPPQVRPSERWPGPSQGRARLFSGAGMPYAVDKFHRGLGPQGSAERGKRAAPCGAGMSSGGWPGTFTGPSLGSRCRPQTAKERIWPRAVW